MSQHIPISAEAREYLATIITSSDDAIISKDLNGNITSWNPAAERIFGYTAQEIVGRHITAIIPPERLAEEDKILATLKAGNRIDHFETWRRHKSGELIPVSITISPIRDNTGKVIGASKIARDISERMKVENAIREAGLKKDEFLANMSHELRTPMNAVVGLANLLKGMDGLPEQARLYVDTLKVSADNLLDLINDLLDYSKIESGSFELENIEFSLAEQIEKAVSVASVRAREKGLELHVNYPASLRRIFKGDPLRIRQIALNLLSNAVKFTSAGAIRVELSGDPQPPDKILVTIRVQDSGIGIPPDKIGAIFDKFTQADSSITRRFGGSGLGLAITKACVSKMEGTISVESEQEIGTVFTVRIPLQTTEKFIAAKTPEPTVMPAAEVQKKNVLLVEDYDANILVAGSMLKYMGFDYDVAKNGLEAIRKFRHGEYDVILMDVQMHEVDGLEATRRIRKIEEERGGRRTPILAMTAHVWDQDKERCFEAGMDDFISKPFEPNFLALKLTHYIPKNSEPAPVMAN